MGDEARGRSDLEFHTTLIHAAIKEACRQAGYTSVQIGGFSLVALPGNVRKLGQVAKQLGLATHIISFDKDRDTVSLIRGNFDDLVLEGFCFAPYANYDLNVSNDTTSDDNPSFGDKHGASGADEST